MNENKKETLSLRLQTETKTKFQELFENSNLSTKTELFQKMLDNFEKEEEIKPLENKTVEDPKIKDPEEENNETIINEETDNDETSVDVKELKLFVNPVQLFALQETVMNEGFIEEVNKVIDRVNEGNDTSFFGNSLFSGDFNGIFSKMKEESENEEDLNENIGVMLVNHFISSIVFGPYDLKTPITQRHLKTFLQESNENITEG